MAANNKTASVRSLLGLETFHRLTFAKIIRALLSKQPIIFPHCAVAECLMRVRCVKQAGLISSFST